MFGEPFLAHYLWCRIEQWCHEEVCLDTHTASLVSKEQPYSLIHLVADLRLRIPVYPNLSLHCLPVATGLGVIGSDKGWLMSCSWLCLKWSKFLRSQPHSLVPAGRQDKVKTAWNQREFRSGQKMTNMQLTAGGAPLLIFCRGLLPYTEGSQLERWLSKEMDQILLFEVELNGSKSINYYIILLFEEFFHTSFSWWFFTGVWFP